LLATNGALPSFPCFQHWFSVWPMPEHYPHLTPHTSVLCKWPHLSRFGFRSLMRKNVVVIWWVDLQIWHTLKPLDTCGFAIILEVEPLKNLVNDSFRAITYFSKVVSLFMPSSYSSLRGSKGFYPNSPSTTQPPLLQQAAPQCWHKSSPCTVS